MIQLYLCRVTKILLSFWSKILFSPVLAEKFSFLLMLISLTAKIWTKITVLTVWWSYQVKANKKRKYHVVIALKTFLVLTSKHFPIKQYNITDFKERLMSLSHHYVFGHFLSSWKITSSSQTGYISF